MCTRFYVEPAVFCPYIERAKRLPLAYQIREKLGKPLTMSGELHPTDVAAVLAPDKNGGIAVFPMLWGFSTPETGAPVVNCRLESADYKPLWKDSWFRRRCAIPASWYYEWEHFASPDGKKRITCAKYAIQPAGRTAAWLAGLYRFEERGGIQVPVFAVITRPADGAVRALHDRMPLILDKESVADWIKPDGNPAEIVKKALTGMVTERVGG
ncbi:MAG: SOS response-associated peptidase family protein [Oscillospiraceae bacterium]|nr:SOS response-associated peptidase family protein [Oscillospiraceae bacterium]